MARSRHPRLHCTGLLLGEEQTLPVAVAIGGKANRGFSMHMSAFDPKRAFARLFVT